MNWCYPNLYQTVESNNLIYDNTPQAAGIIYLISVVCRLNIPKSEIRSVRR
jgi:hypothetical protein